MIYYYLSLLFFSGWDLVIIFASNWSWLEAYRLERDQTLFMSWWLVANLLSTLLRTPKILGFMAAFILSINIFSIYYVEDMAIGVSHMTAWKTD